MIYHFLNLAFFIIHTSLIAGIVLGWTIRWTRPWHFCLCLATLFSWFGLGYCYGWGYCPCTQWHWQVRAQLGAAPLPWSYVKLLVDRWVGGDSPAAWVDTVTVTVFIWCTLSSAVLMLRDRRKRLDQPLSSEGDHHKVEAKTNSGS